MPVIFQALSALISINSLLLILAVLLVVWYLLSPPFTMPIWNSLLFHPAKAPTGNYTVQALGGVPIQEVSIVTSDAHNIHAWFLRKPGAEKTVLISHGNAGNITDRGCLIESLLGTDSSVFLYDYRGYGRSSGEPSVAGLRIDSLAAYDYLVNNLGVEPANLVLYGESLGTGVTCWIASNRPSAGIILQSGFCSLRRAGEHLFPVLRLFPAWLFPEPQFDNLAVVSRAHPPLLLIHGIGDSLLPCWHSETLYNKATPPKLLVKLDSAEHCDVVDYPEYHQAIKEFMSSLPAGRQAGVSG